MTTTFTLAHLTDVHLGPIAGFSPRYWNVKRGLGYINWARNRRAVYRRDVLDRIVADMQAQQPDHIAVTGDLVNIGLPQEHIDALTWLESLGPPERVSVVPGNHDIYSRLRSDTGTRRWAPYMSWNDEAKYIVGEAPEFPFVRVLGDVALIGVNSAIRTPPLLAWGQVGWPQLASLELALSRLWKDSMFRVVLIHHPPLPASAGRFRRLRDAAALEWVLQRHGAELILHGHDHCNASALLDCEPGTAAIVGAPSASLGHLYKNEPLARYNLYRVEGAYDRWTVGLVGRGLIAPGGPVVELERRTFEVGGHEQNSREA